MRPIFKRMISFAAALTFSAAFYNTAFAGITHIHTANNESIHTSDISIPVTDALTKANWTIAVYLCGSDLETQSGCVTNDIIEMLEANIPDNVNVLLMTGGTKEWNPLGAAEDAVSDGRISAGAYLTPDSSRTQVYSITDHKMNLLYSFDKNLNMSDPSVAAAFTEFAVKYAPSEHFMTVFWDHGGGPIIGAENDEYTGEVMTVAELAAAVQKTSDAFGKKIDIVGFDACYMSNIETANLLSSCADYLIAAEGDEPMTGWNYRWLDIFNETNNVSSVEIGKRVVDLCPDETENGWEDTKGITMSLTDLSKASAVAKAVAELGKELNDALLNSDKSAKINRAAEDAARIANGEVGLIDLFAFAYKTRGILDASDSIIAAVGTPPENVLGEVAGGAVIYRGASPDFIDYAGLAVYYPTSNTYIGDSEEETKKWLDIYKSLGLSDDYIKYVEALVLNSDDTKKAFDSEIITDYNGYSNRFSMSVKNPSDLSSVKDVQVITTYTAKNADGSSTTYKLGTQTADKDWDDNYFENPSDGSWGAIDGEYFSYDVTTVGDYLKYSIPVVVGDDNELSLMIAYAPKDDPYSLEIERIYTTSTDADAQRPYLPLYVFTFSTVLLEDNADYSTAGYLKNSQIALTRESAEERYKLNAQSIPFILDENGEYRAYFTIIDMLDNKYTSEPMDISLLMRADYYFLDVEYEDWFFEYVNYAFLNGLMNGTDYRIFSPNMPLNRGMVAAIIYRAEGSPEVSNTISFPDVAADMYYANAVAWGQQAGILDGFDEQHYRPEIQITREQLVKILYRFARYRGIDVSANADVDGFYDADTISGYAVEPIRWALGNGIMKGRSATELAPTAEVTRAETAAIFMRFFTMFD